MSYQRIVWRSKQGRQEMEDHNYCTTKKTTSNSNGGCYRLVSYQELPDYMKDNEYIIDQYRANWPIKLAFFSLFRWHNETLNVWTHLIGFVFFLGLAISNLMQLPHGEISMTSRWPFFVFLGGSMFCLLTSSTCHLFCCHSHRLNLVLLRFDYAGIAVMIVTSFFPPMYYIFQCSPMWQFAYLAGITTMGIFTVITLLSPALSTKEFRPYRALLFFCMGFSGIVPAIHALILNWNEPRRFITLAYESAMALSYATGTFFYVTRIPERWRPGWFDLAGHSHQIFHLFVIIGALAHYAAALVFIDWRDTVGCPILD